VSTVTARVDSRIHLPLAGIPQEALDLMKSALTFPNEEREAAKREQRWGWQEMASTIDLWSQDDEHLYMPRGFGHSVVTGLREYGVETVFDDRRSAPEMSPETLEALVHRRPLWDHQKRAMDDLVKAQQGVLESPTGSGKTVTMLAIAALTRMRCLVVVDRVPLLDQWAQRAHDDLGFRDIGIIGDSQWVEGDLTIALRQSLWSRLHELDVTRFWQRYGMGVVDEVHHLTAETLLAIVSRQTSRLLFGPSATPARSKVKLAIVKSMIGHVEHKTPRDELYRKGILVRPKVVQVPTGFEYPYHPAVRAPGGWQECPLPNCRRDGPHSHRSNYPQMVSKLVKDRERAVTVASKLFQHRQRYQLVITRQVQHIAIMAEAMRDVLSREVDEEGWPDLFELTAKTDSYGREAINEAALADRPRPFVIMSTLAEEALDIPVLDRIHMPFPVRADYLIVQQVGRGERSHPLKRDVLVLDYCDWNVSVTASQAQSRARVYRKAGYEIDRLPVAV
jgi:superfamily II DNA or RNA helicase